jgi:hypothetical protein
MFDPRFIQLQTPSRRGGTLPVDGGLLHLMPDPGDPKGGGKQTGQSQPTKPEKQPKPSN